MRSAIACHRGERGRLDLEAELGGEARGPHHAQRVVPERHVGLDGRAQQPARQVVEAAERIDELARRPPHRHRVDGEVAPRKVALERVAKRHDGLARDAVVLVRAERRDLDHEIVRAARRWCQSRVPCPTWRVVHVASRRSVSSGRADVAKSKSALDRPRKASRTGPPTSANSWPAASNVAASSATSGGSATLKGLGARREHVARGDGRGRWAWSWVPASHEPRLDASRAGRARSQRDTARRWGEADAPGTTFAPRLELGHAGLADSPPWPHAAASGGCDDSATAARSASRRWPVAGVARGVGGRHGRQGRGRRRLRGVHRPPQPLRVASSGACPRDTSKRGETPERPRCARWRKRRGSPRRSCSPWRDRLLVHGRRPPGSQEGPPLPHGGDRAATSRRRTTPTTRPRSPSGFRSRTSALDSRSPMSARWRKWPPSC